MTRFSISSKGGTNAVGTKRDGHTYAIVYADGRESDALRQLGRWAGSPEVNFTWTDAAAIAEAIRKEPTHAAP